MIQESMSAAESLQAYTAAARRCMAARDGIILTLIEIIRAKGCTIAEEGMLQQIERQIQENSKT